MRTESSFGVGVAFASGVWSWALVVPGRTGHDPVPLGLLTVLLCLSAMLGMLVSSASPSAVGTATLAGPVLAAGWTFPRGDGDGLWAGIYLVLAGILLLTIAVAGCVGRFGRFGPVPRIRNFVGARRTLVTWGVAGFVVAAGAFIDVRRPDPYPVLQSVAGRVPIPAGFDSRTARRLGDPLCEGTCGPRLEIQYRTEMAGPEACTATEEALDQWENQPVTPSPPIYSPSARWFEICAWRADVGDARVLIAVSDDSKGRALVLETF